MTFDDYERIQELRELQNATRTYCGNCPGCGSRLKSDHEKMLPYCLNGCKE